MPTLAAREDQGRLPAFGVRQRPLCEGPACTSTTEPLAPLRVREVIKRLPISDHQGSGRKRHAIQPISRCLRPRAGQATVVGQLGEKSMTRYSVAGVWRVARQVS
jgi:hypothetical protein